MNENLKTAIEDLTKAIQEICLGSVEWAVILAAGRTLILNWNYHNREDQIDTYKELEAFQKRRFLIKRISRAS